MINKSPTPMGKNWLSESLSSPCINCSEKTITMEQPLYAGSLSRRGFLRLSCVVATAGVTISPLAKAIEAAVNDQEKVTWSSCTVNCGSRCPLKVITKGGQIIRIEPDNVGSDTTNMPFEVPHVKACARGRSIRQRIYSPDRLKFPLKRVGERGEGKFERISWDQAIDEVAKNLKNVIDKYGNEAVYVQYGSGSYQLVSNLDAAKRLLNMLGGYLEQYGTYSSAQIREGMPYTWGFGGNGSYVTEIANAKLHLNFGNNPYVTRSSGGGKAWENECARQKGNTKTIIIDPIYTDSCLGKEDEWIPIKIGTDAALCEGMAYVMITENLVDQPFLDKYCIGYDEKTLPEGAPAKGDYKSYILGEGPDKTPKTPEYASKITGIPAATITRLAREAATTKPLFVSQGYGPQRQANGEQTVRAISMIPILTGQVGLPGTNNASRPNDVELGAVGLPAGKNPVKTSISFFTWTDAIRRGPEMTALKDGVRGKDKLDTGIKFLWCQQSNVIGNQHSSLDETARILKNDKDCEFILVIDNQMTPSAKFADILLPDTMQQETTDYAADGYASGTGNFLVALQKAIDPQWEQKSAYEICTLLADKFGIKDKYTEGKSQLDWVKWCYGETAKKHPDALPSFDEFWKVGIIKIPGLGKSPVTCKEFRDDPEKNPLKTPSGKIEIYSVRLAKIADTWELEPDECISALPQFCPTFEMAGFDPAVKKYPLQCFGYHFPGRTHSSYHNVPWLRELHPDHLLINPIDATPRGIKTGDVVKVYNDRGTVLVPAKVTPRIIPGCTSIPQGAWRNLDENGVDKGACINTLTTLRWSPLAKANPQHTNLVEVAKVGGA